MKWGQAGVLVGLQVAVVDLEVELIVGDQREHHAVLVNAPAAEHPARTHAAQRLEAFQDELDELAARSHFLCARFPRIAVVTTVVPDARGATRKPVRSAGRGRIDQGAHPGKHPLEHGGREPAGVQIVA